MTERIEGTTCNVELHGDHVRKYPKKISAEELYDRQQEAIGLMRQHYYNMVDAIIPLVEIELIDSPGEEPYLKQERVDGKPLAKLTEQEIDNLPTETKRALWHLLRCNEDVREKNETGNFIDLFGYDEDLNFFLKRWRTLNVRYSTNIYITYDNQVKLIDPDIYYREERSPFKKYASKKLTPQMFKYIAKFRKRLSEAITQEQRA